MASEYTNCNLCAIDDTRLIFRERERNIFGTENFNIVRCKKCGLVYVNPRPSPEEIKKYYPKEYFFQLNLEKIDKKEKFRLDAMCAGRLREIMDFKKSGRILDMGCGDGYFLAYLKQKGWQAQGLDISGFAAGMIKQKFGIDVFCGELTKAAYPDEYFDAVSLFEVLEHLPDPVSALLEIYRILKKSGLLIMSVPNFDSLQKTIFGKYWHIVDPPRHLFYFSKTTLEGMLRKSEFSRYIIKVINGSGVLSIKTPSAFSEDVRNLLKCLSPDLIGGRYKKESWDPQIKKTELVKDLLHRFEAAVFLLPGLLAKILGKEDTLLIKVIK